MLQNKGLAALQGFCPEPRVAEISAAAKANGWGIRVEDPTDEDSVPTLLGYNKLSRPMQIDSKKVAQARSILANGVDVNNMMKVVGEEGTSIEDFIVYLKSEYLDAVYLQQDAYNEIDAACSAERQKYVFDKIYTILMTPMTFTEKDVARTFFLKLTQATKDWNRVAFDSQEFKDLESSIFASVKEVSANA